MPVPVSVVVVGAGVAGMSAALWCVSLGLGVVLVEARERHGGQLHEIPLPVENLPGHTPVMGAALAERLRSQLIDAGVDVRVHARAELDPRSLTVRLGDGEVLTPSAVVLATGVRRRRLGVPGERALVGRGVHHNIGPDPRAYAGQHVVVVGGGDDAFEHALMVAPHAASVTLVHRSDRFSARDAFLAPVRADARVALRTFAEVEAIEGAARVEAVRVRTREGCERLRADMVFVCVGPEPASEGFGVATDARGYVRVDRLQHTSRAGVFAVGDVCCPEAPTIATAMGHGATAAKVIAARGAPPVATPAHTDRLTLHSLSLPARIGVYPREWRRRQTLTFEIAFEVDAGAASPSDSLQRTIDYAAVASSVEALLAEQHFNLIETVADVLATRLLANYESRSVRVRVTKPGVPQRHASASIEVERRRA